MKRIKQFYVIIVGIILVSCQHKENITDNRPNVILVMTDDQGYGDLAAHGNPHIKTPHLDKLHNESIRLANFHVGTTCAPTRAALMTGRDGNRVGVWHTIAGRSQLDRSEVTMADIFTKNGYKTGMFGKWHLGDSYPFRPHDRGFHETLYHGGGGVGQGPDYWDNDYFDDTYFRNGEPEKTEGYCTDVWFDAAKDFIDNQGDQPFFTYIATNAPHHPFLVDSSYIRPYLGIEGVNPNFYGMITNIDDNMGRLMAYLDENNLTDNTILIFMTDNGTAAGASHDKDGHITGGYNAGMRGRKVWQYEGGHRVPCFIRWPDGEWTGGTSSDLFALTAHIDLLPTLVDKIGLDDMNVGFDGVSIAPILDNLDEADHSDLANRILITDTQRRENPIKWHRSSTMMDKWRLIDGDQLYHIGDDPGQKNDIASDHPDIVTKLRAGYEKWWTDVSQSFGQYTRAEIGPNSETILYSHDWHQSENNLGEPNTAKDGSYLVPWNHRQIRSGQQVSGTWTVEFMESGTYNFELRRWPREADLDLSKGLPTPRPVDGMTEFVKGESLPINKASLVINDNTVATTVVNEDENAIGFNVEVQKGYGTVKTYFTGNDGLRLGAYYVYVNKVIGG